MYCTRVDVKKEQMEKKERKVFRELFTQSMVCMKASFYFFFNEHALVLKWNECSA